MIKNRLPLSLISSGEHVRLVKIEAGKKLTRRLTAMGLTRGVELKIIQAAGGPLLISIRGSRIALGRGVAHKIFVEFITENNDGGEQFFHEADKHCTRRKSKHWKKHHFQRTNWFAPARWKLAGQDRREKGR